MNPHKSINEALARVYTPLKESFWATTTDYTDDSKEGEDCFAAGGVPGGNGRILRAIEDLIADDGGKVSAETLAYVERKLDTHPENRGAIKLAAWLQWVHDNDKTLRPTVGEEGREFFSF